MLLDAFSPFLSRDIELTTTLDNMDTRHDPDGGDVVSADIEICAWSLGRHIDLPDSFFIAQSVLGMKDYVRTRLHWYSYL